MHGEIAAIYWCINWGFYWSLGFRNVTCCTDSQCVIDLIMTSTPPIHKYACLLHDIARLLHLDSLHGQIWSFSSWRTFDIPPQDPTSLLIADMVGVKFLRLYFFSPFSSFLVVVLQKMCSSIYKLWVFLEKLKKKKLYW